MYMFSRIFRLRRHKNQGLELIVVDWHVDLEVLLNLILVGVDQLKPITMVYLLIA